MKKNANSPLSIAAITASINAKPMHIDVDVPELGGPVRLKRLNAGAAVALGRKYKSLAGATGTIEGDNLIEFMVLVLVNSIVDENDKPGLLSEEGKAVVRRFPLSVLNRLGEKAMELNELGSSTAVEEREKN